LEEVVATLESPVRSVRGPIGVCSPDDVHEVHTPKDDGEAPVTVEDSRQSLQRSGREHVIIAEDVHVVAVGRFEDRLHVSIEPDVLIVSPIGNDARVERDETSDDGGRGV